MAPDYHLQGVQRISERLKFAAAQLGRVALKLKDAPLQTLALVRKRLRLAGGFLRSVDCPLLTLGQEVLPRVELVCESDKAGDLPVPVIGLEPAHDLVELLLGPDLRERV